MLLHALLHKNYMTITQQLHVCNTYVIKFHFTWTLHGNYMSYYTQITQELHLCNIYVITWHYMNITWNITWILRPFKKFIIKISNACNGHVITWTQYVLPCNYILRIYYIEFTRVFLTHYIRIMSILHAACNINVNEYVMTFPPISESRGERHYMQLQELYITISWPLHSACIWYVKNYVILCNILQVSITSHITWKNTLHWNYIYITSITHITYINQIFIVLLLKNHYIIITWILHIRYMYYIG